MSQNIKPTHIVVKEADLYPIIKKSFKNDGYAVYAEVASMYRGVDMVAAKGDEHIAIELKLAFNWHLLRQATWNASHFDKVYVAYPVKKAVLFHVDDVYWSLRESTRERYDYCVKWGVGIMQVLPSGLIYEALEPKQQKPFRKLDLQHYVDADDDVGGVPYQKGVSEGYHELESIKKYVIANPTASWREIFANVPTHYASHTSLASSMSQWRGFYLQAFKDSLK
jgi:hypothetical protein